MLAAITCNMCSLISSHVSGRGGGRRSSEEEHAEKGPAREGESW